MGRTGFFKRLADRERALALNPGVGGLLCETLAAQDALRVAPPIVRECLLANVAYAYQHYGFDVFAPSAQSLLAVGLARDAAVPLESALGWLEETAYALLEDFAVLGLLEGEPVWDAVDASFFRAVAKRAICAEPGEAADLGLDCWDPDMIGFLRLVASEGLELVRNGASPDEIASHASRRLEGRPDAAVFEDALRECFDDLHENPLRLLVWRVEGFSSFTDIRQEAKFFVRCETRYVERRAFELAGLLSLLYPHRTEDGVRLLEDSPVTLAQLERALLGLSPSSHRFDCGLLREWMGVGTPGDEGNTKETVAGRLAQIVDESLRLGLVFEIARVGRKGARPVSQYGLSKVAMGILRPFAGSITLALRAAEKDVADTVDTAEDAAPALGPVARKKETPRATPVA